MAQTPDFEGAWTPELTLPLLGNKTTDIRLLTLLPGSIGDHIRCTLSTASLASNETIYNALSYTWGDPSGQRSIECNGCRAYIGRNLHSALSRLRDMHETVVLWADALCINQSETDEALEEREVQVQLMHKIFSQAELVYVDLGEDVPEMEMILQFLQNYISILSRVLKTRPFNEAFQSDTLPSIDHPTWPDIVRFMRRPWFTRVWIMQEFILAKHVQVIVGIRRLQFVFLELMGLLIIYFYKLLSTSIPTSKHVEEFPFSVSCRCGRLLPHIDQGPGNLLSLVVARENRQMNKTDYRSFSALLRQSGTFDATDKRDRAYALLSLAVDVDHDIFPVRYKNETLDQTAQRVSRYLLVESDGRHVTGRAALYRTVGLLGPGASWTYDLAGSVHDDLLENTDDKGESSLYHASVGSDRLQASIADQILTVRGHVLGSITQLTNVFVPLETGQDHQSVQIPNWILGTARWATRIQHLPNTELDTTAVWITAFAGFFFVGKWARQREVRYDPEEHPELSRQLSDFVKNVDALREKVGDSGRIEDVGAQGKQLVSRMLPIISMIGARASGRRLAYTSDNLLALVPGSAEVGDVLSIFQGTPIPFVLRKAQGNYRLNGTAYIHNMMDGEVSRDPRYTVQNIDIC